MNMMEMFSWLDGTGRLWDIGCGGGVGCAAGLLVFK